MILLLWRVDWNSPTHSLISSLIEPSRSLLSTGHLRLLQILTAGKNAREFIGHVSSLGGGGGRGTWDTQTVIVALMLSTGKPVSSAARFVFVPEVNLRDCYIFYKLARVTWIPFIPLENPYWEENREFVLTLPFVLFLLLRTCFSLWYLYKYPVAMWYMKWLSLKPRRSGTKCSSLWMR